ESKVSFRYDESKRTLFVREDPIEVLETLKAYPGISQSAHRALLERTLESELQREWPDIVDPRVCIAFPNGAIRDESDSEPISMIMAKGLDSRNIPAARDFVASRVEGLPAKNVLIMGTVKREIKPRS